MISLLGPVAPYNFCKYPYAVLPEVTMVLQSLSYLTVVILVKRRH